MATLFFGRMNICDIFCNTPSNIQIKQQYNRPLEKLARNWRQYKRFHAWKVHLSWLVAKKNIFKFKINFAVLEILENYWRSCFHKFFMDLTEQYQLAIQSKLTYCWESAGSIHFLMFFGCLCQYFHFDQKITCQ